jgi:hypothetical protein
MAGKTIRAMVSVTDPQLQAPFTQVFTLGHPRVP